MRISDIQSLNWGFVVTSLNCRQLFIRKLPCRHTKHELIRLPIPRAEVNSTDSVDRHLHDQNDKHGKRFVHICWRQQTLLRVTCPLQPASQPNRQTVFPQYPPTPTPLEQLLFRKHLVRLFVSRRGRCYYIRIGLEVAPCRVRGREYTHVYCEVWAGGIKEDGRLSGMVELRAVH